MHGRVLRSMPLSIVRVRNIWAPQLDRIIKLHMSHDEASLTRRIYKCARRVVIVAAQHHAWLFKNDSVQINALILPGSRGNRRLACGIDMATVFTISYIAVPRYVNTHGVTYYSTRGDRHNHKRCLSSTRPPNENRRKTQHLRRCPAPNPHVACQTHAY